MQGRVFVTLWLLVWMWLAPATTPVVFAEAIHDEDGASETFADATSSARNLRVFDAVCNLVGNKYYDKNFNGADWATLKSNFRSQAAGATDERGLYRVINQMLAELNDQHTFAIPPTLVQEENRGSRIGIGFHLRKIGDQWVVSRVSGGSAAQEAGIRPGWIITEWDGQPFNGSNSSSLKNGQSVRLKFLDPNDNVKRVEVICRPFATTPEQRSQLLPNGILYIRFTEFAPNTARWLDAQLDANRQARGVIFDLRDNGGGLLNILSDCLQLIYRRDLVFGDFIQREKRQFRMRINGGGRSAFDGSVVVLVDEGSASAAEIFAAAVQESKRGTVIGRRTAGAVLASIEERLPDGGKVQISVRDYRTAQGVRLEGQGVNPDISIPLTLSEIRRNVDFDLDRATGLLTPNAAPSRAKR
jgi:carboxyl-terminal processing protease